MPIQQFFSYIMAREHVNFRWNDDEDHFVLDQHTYFDLYSDSSLKQQSVGRHFAPLGHIILIPSQQVFASVYHASTLNKTLLCFALSP